MKPLNDRQRSRLIRAIHLEVTDTGPGVWTVSGGAEPHRVFTTHDGRLDCDCMDHQLRNRECKHIYATRLATGDRTVVGALREIVPRHQSQRI